MKGKKEKHTMKSFASKVFIAIGVAVVFYKLPSVIAEKISYYQLQNKDFNQGLYEEEK